VGRELERFGPFRVVSADLTQTLDFIATFSPRTGFLPAEFEPGAGPFRWSEAWSEAALRVVSRATCATLHGELRTAGPEGLVTILSADDSVYGAFASPKWAPFVTAPLDVRTERSIETRFERTGGLPSPDASHVVAYRRLSLVPDSTCVRLLGTDVREAEVTVPLFFASEEHVHLSPAVGLDCGRVHLTVSGALDSELGVSLDGAAVDFHLITSDPASVDTDVIRFSRAPDLGLLRRGGKNPTVSITTLAVEPAPCPL
jgi:hypothetical protein